MPRVFVSDFIPGDILEPLETLAEVEVWDEKERVPRETLLSRLADCDGWLSMLSDRIDVELLDSAPKLKVISQMSVGVDNIDIEACRGHGVAVGHTPDVLTETTADTAFALIGAAVRRLPEGEAIVKSGAWGPWDPWHFLSSDLHGATLGIVGMGRIGQAIARRARGFDMNVLYTARTSKDVPGAERLDLATLLERADIVVIAVPLSDETRGMIGRAELRLMKDSAMLVNVARGPIVDTDDLVEALAEGTYRRGRPRCHRSGAPAPRPSLAPVPQLPGGAPHRQCDHPGAEGDGRPRRGESRRLFPPGAHACMAPGQRRTTLGRLLCPEFPL